MGDDNRSRDLDWENRVLCGDESCIGVIGADGRCKECGLVYEGELPGGRTPPTDGLQTDPIHPVDVEESAVGEDAQKTGAESTDTDKEWAQRTLCRDESCIGVIGPDGRCKECGLPYEGNN